MLHGKHRRTIDGRLCAAAFVQDRQAYTGCTDAPNPEGVSGRPWCYVEPQLTEGDATWGFCAPVIDYAAVRSATKRVLSAKVGEVQGAVGKLHGAQIAAESALDMYRKHCA